MGWVWDHSRARSNDRLVLLCLANHYSAQEQAACVSVEVLATECGIAQRTVQRCLRTLAELGEIAPRPRYNDAGATTTPVYAFPLFSMGRQIDTPPGVNLTPSPGEHGQTGTFGGDNLTPPTDTPSNKTNTHPARRATRLPEPFMLTAPMREWAAKEMGIEGEAVREATREFVDYWRGVPGQRGTKLDWPATWRNSLRGWAKRNRSAVRSGSGGITGVPEPGGRR